MKRVFPRSLFCALAMLALPGLAESAPPSPVDDDSIPNACDLVPHSLLEQLVGKSVKPGDANIPNPIVSKCTWKDGEHTLMTLAITHSGTYARETVNIRPDFHVMDLFGLKGVAAAAFFPSDPATRTPERVALLAIVKHNYTLLFKPQGVEIRQYSRQLEILKKIANTAIRDL